MAAEMVSDPRDTPASIGEADHLQAVTKAGGDIRGMGPGTEVSTLGVGQGMRIMAGSSLPPVCDILHCTCLVVHPGSEW